MKLYSLLMARWRWLIGSNEKFELPQRIFHSVCLIVLPALLYNVPFNYLIGLNHIALLSAVSFILFCVIYYLSRFKKKYTITITAFCIIGMSLFVINFFLNSGINGPTDLFLVLTMIVMVSIIPVNRYWVWVLINLSTVLTLHLIQYMHPNWVPDTYTSKWSQYVDITSAYFVVIVMVLYNFYIIRRNYEREKLSAEQKTAMMQMLNEEKNKLLSIISHDLRAPLSNVQSYLEILTQFDISADERQDIKRKLLVTTKSSLEMLNNVLSWSKNQMSGLKFQVTPISLHEFLSPQLQLFTNIAEGKGIGVKIYISNGIKVLANGDMLQVIIRNLINNAIKFTSPGGMIKISAVAENDMIKISVKDSGNGSPAVLSNNIFYLNSGSTRGTADEKGVGLGLVLCKEFTEAQHGRIWFDNDPISGVTFFVLLPGVI